MAEIRFDKRVKMYLLLRLIHNNCLAATNSDMCLCVNKCDLAENNLCNKIYLNVLLNVLVKSIISQIWAKTSLQKVHKESRKYMLAVLNVYIGVFLYMCPRRTLALALFLFLHRWKFTHQKQSGTSCCERKTPLVSLAVAYTYIYIFYSPKRLIKIVKHDDNIPVICHFHFGS